MMKLLIDMRLHLMRNGDVLRLQSQIGHQLSIFLWEPLEIKLWHRFSYHIRRWCPYE